MLQLLQPPGSVLQLVNQAGSGHKRRPPACQRSLARWPRTPLPGLREDFLAAKSESGLWQADLLTRTCKRSCKDLLERTLLRSPPKKTCRGFAQDHASASYRWFHQGPDNMFSQRLTCAKSSRTSCRHLTRMATKSFLKDLHGTMRGNVTNPSWHAWLITCVTYLSKYHTWPCMASWPCILKSLVSFAKASGHGTPCTSYHSVARPAAPKVWTMWGCLRWALPASNHTGGPLEAAKLCIDRLEPCNLSGEFRGINLWGWSSPQKVARRNPIWNTWTKKYQKKNWIKNLFAASIHKRGPLKNLECGHNA